MILIGHWLNSYLLFTPGTLNEHGHIGVYEIGVFLGFIGLFIYVVSKSLTQTSIQIKSHPYLEESKHLHT